MLTDDCVGCCEELENGFGALNGSEALSAPPKRDAADCIVVTSCGGGSDLFIVLPT